MFRGDQAYAKQRLHQKWVFPIGAGQTVRAVIVDCHELVQFVVAQTLAADAGDAQGEARNDQHRQEDCQNPAAEKFRDVVCE